MFPLKRHKPLSTHGTPAPTSGFARSKAIEDGRPANGKVSKAYRGSRVVWGFGVEGSHGLVRVRVVRLY